MDRITIGGVMVSVHASSVVDLVDRITIGVVMVSVHASSAVDRMDRITIDANNYTTDGDAVHTIYRT
jgi:uncharacterized protein YlxP (DUF503 family)